jgi:hypothetical protein
MQAMDRAFRIGQRRNVNVYRLVATGTIEEPMYSRQVRHCILLPLRLKATTGLLPSCSCWTNALNVGTTAGQNISDNHPVLAALQIYKQQQSEMAMEGTHQRRYWQGACVAPSEAHTIHYGLAGISHHATWHVLARINISFALGFDIAGVQNMPGRKGELWGIANLLSYTGDTIKTLDVIDTHRQKVGLQIHAVLHCRAG